MVQGGGHDAPLLTLLARLLTSAQAPIEVLTAASGYEPARTHAAYAAELSTLGYPRVGHLHFDATHPADDPATLARLRAAELLLLSGGDQELLTECLLGTEFLAVLRQRCLHDHSFILAGTSAGAAALGTQMLVGGRGWRSLLAGGIEVLPGLDLLPGLLIDQHFAERARYPRLLHAVLAYPHLLGLGLNEETGLLFRAGRPPEVFGEEMVMLIDGRQLRARRYEGLPPGQPVGGQGFQLSMLVAGDTIAMSNEQ